MGSKIIVAGDRLSLATCMDLAQTLRGRIHAIKIHDLMDAEGHRAVGKLKSMNIPVWIDYKLHDIPDTVGARAKELTQSGASILTVHAAGGVTMMKAALDNAPDAKIFAVTVLTSLSDVNCEHLYGDDRERTVLRLAELAVEAGVHGIVCSAKEVMMLRRELGPSVRLIVPGVRSPGKEVHDQKNVETPALAIARGADFLVIGRQVTEAADPLAALVAIEEEICEVAS